MRLKRMKVKELLFWSLSSWKQSEGTEMGLVMPQDCQCQPLTNGVVVKMGGGQEPCSSPQLG